MEAPEYFTSRLDREFRGRLRIRWSYSKEEWHLEQKMGRGIFEVPIDPYNDQWTRVRDGYSHVMAIKPNDWMYCPLCHAKVAIPVMHTAEAKCERCAKKGIDARWRAAFYPLNERLIDWLKRIDPERVNAAQEMAEEADRANEQLDKLKERNTLNHVESATWDNYRKIVGIPSVGLSGATKFWID